MNLIEHRVNEMGAVTSIFIPASARLIFCNEAEDKTLLCVDIGAEEENLTCRDFIVFKSSDLMGKISDVMLEVKRNFINPKVVFVSSTKFGSDKENLSIYEILEQRIL